MSQDELQQADNGRAQCPAFFFALRRS